MSVDLSKKRETSALDPETLPAFEKAKFRELLDAAAEANFFGMFGRGRRHYDAPTYLSTGAERVVSNGNSGIVLGLDRPGNKLSGFGGKGNTHCAAVDIVAGRMASYATSKTSKGEDVLVNPNFKLDAARVWISQKSNVDSYFDLAAGTVGSTSSEDPRSAVALKADTVRIIGRENIKLVTRTDKRNSQGGETDNTYKGQYGIDLIAMNDDADMQSLVKGENLVACLNAIVDSVVSLRTIVENQTEYTREMFTSIMTHTHISPFYGISTAPDFQACLPDGVEFILNSVLNAEVPMMLTHMMETTSIVNDYLSDEGGMGSAKYICSKYNHTN
jgi:hypothetical protein